MQACVLRQPTFLNHVFGRLVRRADLNQYVAVLMVMFAKVSAEAALSIVNGLHVCSFLSMSQKVQLPCQVTLGSEIYTR
jgi:hypothetical protein